jgi:hypothetical protein
MMTRAALRAEWQTRLTDYYHSGLSATAWCAAHDVKLHQLQYWTRRLALPEAGAPADLQWAPMTVVGEAPSADDGLQLRVGPATLTVRPGFDPALLVAVVRALGPVC